jgi:hypothetical protein
VKITEMLVDDLDDAIELQDDVALMQWISSTERQKRGLPCSFILVLSAFLQRRHYRYKEWCCLQAANQVDCSYGVQNACNVMIGL